MNNAAITACRELAATYIASHGGGEIDAQLGDGGSAVVFRWVGAGVTRALKVYDPKFLSSDAAPAERYRLDLQRRLISQHCPSMVDTLSVEEDLDTCFVTMEYFAGNELKKVIGKIPDDAIESLIRQLVEAVLFLEGFGLVHRDIKPENILVSEDFSQIKLLDLGVIRTISDDEDRVGATDSGEKRPFIATAQYSSPEYLFRLEPPSTALWKALTIYQVGGVLHDLVCKKPLFEKAVAAENKYALAMAVMREQPDFSGASPAVSTWAALAARCLSKDSALRLQIVDWSDFIHRAESAKEKLKRALDTRAASVGRAEHSETQAHLLRKARSDRLQAVIEALRTQLISQFAPHVRVSQLGGNEYRACLLVKLTDADLGVKLALECAWESGTRETFAVVRLAAITAREHENTEFSGERHAVGEVNIDGTAQAQLLDQLIESTSAVLVKHAELVESGSIYDEIDLIPLIWPK